MKKQNSGKNVTMDTYNIKSLMIFFTIIITILTVVFVQSFAFATENNSEDIVSTMESSNIIESLANSAIDKAKEGIDNYNEEYGEEIKINFDSSETLFQKIIDWIVTFFKRIMHNFLVTSKDDLVETLNDEIKAQSKEIQQDAINQMSEIASVTTNSSSNTNEENNFGNLRETLGVFKNLLRTQ